MEPFEIQPDSFVEKQKEVIAQLTNENILLTCRIDQLEQDVEHWKNELRKLTKANLAEFQQDIPDSHLHDDPRPRSAWSEAAEEAEAVEVAKDDGWDVT